MFLRDAPRKLHGTLECFNVYHGEKKNTLVYKFKPTKNLKTKKINPLFRKTKKMIKRMFEKDDDKKKKDDARNFATD